MVFKLLEKVFSSANDRAIKTFQPDVAKVNALESKIKVLTDAQLQGKTGEFRTKLEQARLWTASVTKLLPSREKRLGECSACAHTTFKSSEAMYFTQDKSLK